MAGDGTTDRGNETLVRQEGAIAVTSSADPMTTIDLSTASELAAQLRVDSIRSSTSAGSGHPTSSMSAADILAVLVGRHLRYDWDNPVAAGNDHLIFSKGHASPLLYSVYKAVGVVSDEELMTQYRRFGSRLEGHPTPVLPWVDVATGSLGQGLPDGVGVALAGSHLDRLPYRVWVLCGDSEMAEGSIWEALDKAATTNWQTWSRSSTSTGWANADRRLGWDIEAYSQRATFGARVFSIDGHNLPEIDEALTAAADGSGPGPTVILARTVKGRLLRGRGQRRLARQGPRGHGGARDRRVGRRAWPGGPGPSAGRRQRTHRPNSIASESVARSPADVAVGEKVAPGRRTVTRSSTRRPVSALVALDGEVNTCMRTSSPRPIRTATSRCSSRNSNSWRPRSG